MSDIPVITHAQSRRIRDDIYPSTSDFTPIQQEIIVELTRSNNYNHIAAVLGISRDSVRYHVARIAEIWMDFRGYSPFVRELRLVLLGLDSKPCSPRVRAYRAGQTTDIRTLAMLAATMVDKPVPVEPPLISESITTEYNLLSEAFSNLDGLDEVPPNDPCETQSGTPASVVAASENEQAQYTVHESALVDAHAPAICWIGTISFLLALAIFFTGYMLGAGAANRVHDLDVTHRTYDNEPYVYPCDGTDAPCAPSQSLLTPPMSATIGQ